MKNYLNYKFDEAETLKKIYSSWIGRDAHTGYGKKQVLKDIIITQHKLQRPLADAAIYKVEFIFNDNNVLSAYEFLSYNSLISTNRVQETSNKKSSSAA
ncbi:MAG: hypothetical protein ACXVO9_01555 [Bacteroidia bacterium]